MGPLLWKRQPPEDAQDPSAQNAVPDYRVHREEEHEDRQTQPPSDAEKGSISSGSAQQVPEKRRPANLAPIDGHPIAGERYEPRNLWIILRYKSLPYLWWLVSHGSQGERVPSTCQWRGHS